MLRRALARTFTGVAAWLGAAALLGTAACAGGDGGAGSGAGAGSASSSSSGSSSQSGSSSGSSGAGGGAGVSCNSIVEELRVDLAGGLLKQAAASGWPAPATDGHLFVSTDAKLGFVAGDHDGWKGTPMTAEASFRWLCLPVDAGDRYKLTDKTDFIADPWARSYTYDDFGEMSLVAPTVSHLDRYFDVGDAKLAGRPVRVWVPEGGYSRVLYTHDGQNLFDPDAIWGGWRLQESAGAGILIVGIDNTPARMDEYTHVEDVIDGSTYGGLGDAYADFLKNTVRPLIQERYGEKGPVGVMGSSLGGLISFHIADRHPGEYAFAASLSGTMGWGSIGVNNETMIERYQKKGHQGTALYLDSGGGGTCFDSDNDGILDDDPSAADNYCENIQMKDALLGVGYVEGNDLFHWWEPDALHNEAEWAKRVFRPINVFNAL